MFYVGENTIQLLLRITRMHVSLSCLLSLFKPRSKFISFFFYIYLFRGWSIGRGNLSGVCVPPKRRRNSEGDAHEHGRPTTNRKSTPFFRARIKCENALKAFAQHRSHCALPSPLKRTEKITACTRPRKNNKLHPKIVGSCPNKINKILVPSPSPYALRTPLAARSSTICVVIYEFFCNIRRHRHAKHSMRHTHRHGHDTVRYCETNFANL